ncbi:MAG: biotin--[acetyl-CoA-carboxylase] ligase [Candidatus Marinimicrobia bacterium CG08_land_8_20_14_0_20_45_22]|nr:MAG: biotin--[acetyl-CoA-carboxylase] ligase [Candidatus Marinimicrobia bacterium CG08_land_8_20_14_0_20_45_22]
MNSFKITKLPIETKILKSQVIHFESIDSTNAYLLGKHTHPHGTIVLADYQTAGRGRRGRQWISPPESAILFSIYLRENFREIPIYAFTFLAAVGVFEGIARFVSPDSISLKWPNDVMIHHRKVCGILVQSKSSSEEMSITIGIGVNVSQPSSFFKDDLVNACSILSATGIRLERIELLNSIAEALDANLELLNQSGADAIMTKWKHYCPYIGGKIVVTDDFNRYEGIFQDVSPIGALILKTETGDRTFHAAEVSIEKETLS